MTDKELTPAEAFALWLEQQLESRNITDEFFNAEDNTQENK